MKNYTNLAIKRLLLLGLLLMVGSFTVYGQDHTEEDDWWHDFDTENDYIDLDEVCVGCDDTYCVECACDPFYCPDNDDNGGYDPTDDGGYEDPCPSGDPCECYGVGCDTNTVGVNNSNGPGKDYVPKSTDKLVKTSIVTTCDKQSKLPVCVLTSLEVTLKNVLGLTVSSKEISTAALISTGNADFLNKGLTPAEAIKLIKSFCITEALTKSNYKTAIDNGKTFITDIKTGTETFPNPVFPNDRSKDITKISSHSVSVIGYDVDGNYIYIDPALGKAQVAPPSDMGFSYSIIIKGKK